MEVALAGGGWHGVLLDNRRSTLPWLLLPTDHTKMQHLKASAMLSYHTTVWVWNSSVAWLGNSSALNGISRGYWCRVWFGGWSSLQESRQLYSRVGKAGLVGPSPRDAVYHHGQRQEVGASSLLRFGHGNWYTFRHCTNQSSHRMCPAQRERAQIPRLSTRECQRVWPHP